MIKIFIAFIIFLIMIDLVWLLGAKSFHQKTISNIQKSNLEINYIASFLFYILAATAYIILVYPQAKSLKLAFLYGCMLGLAMYGTFDLTNKAIFTNYPWSYAIFDMLWGTFCVGLVSAIIFKLQI